MSVWIAYTDDSGDGAFSVHSALLVPVPDWSESLTKWKRYRRALKKQMTVPPEYELHASKWIMGKDQPGIKDAPINTTVGLRREWAVKALKAISDMPGLGVFTVITHTAVKGDAYRDFVLQLDGALEERNGHAVVVMDGDPRAADPHIKQVHRGLALSSRRVLEDGWVQDSTASQFIQMADLVAHCAYQHHARKPERDFMWKWYPTHLHAHEWACACDGPDPTA